MRHHRHIALLRFCFAFLLFLAGKIHMLNSPFKKGKICLHLLFISNDHHRIFLVMSYCNTTFMIILFFLVVFAQKITAMLLKTIVRKKKCDCRREDMQCGKVNRAGDESATRGRKVIWRVELEMVIAERVGQTAICFPFISKEICSGNEQLMVDRGNSLRLSVPVCQMFRQLSRGCLQ